MNDRYLYRAKRTDNGEWVEGCLISDKLDDNILFIGNSYGLDMCDDPEYFDLIMVKPSTICQCTGEPDKNGKLIFEHDIIKHYNDTSHPDKYDKGIVRWNDFNIRFERYSAEMKGNVCMNRDCVYEVIGNIFDNPELLEVGEC